MFLRASCSGDGIRGIAVDLCRQPDSVVVEAMQEVAAPPTRAPIAKINLPREPEQK